MAIKNAGYLFKRNNTYYLQYDINGKRKVQSLRTRSQREADKRRDEILTPLINLKNHHDFVHHIARAKNIYQPKKFPIDIIEPKFEKYLQRKDSSTDAIKRYKYRIKQFLSWVKNNHPEIVDLANIIDMIAQEYADWLGKTDIANKTYNETLNSLALIFNVFQDEADIIKNPFRKENLPRKNKLPISRKEFTEDQIKEILNSFHNIQNVDKDETEVLFYLGIFAGLRLKDACLLKWDSINLSTNNMYITPEKTKQYGTFVNIPLHPALKDKIKTALNWRKNDYVLPKLAERYLRSRDNVRKLVAQIIELNGFSTTKNKNELSGVRNKSVCIYGFHSLRYTFVSICAKSGVPLTLVQEIVGHKNPAMTQHYTKFDDKFRQKVICQLNLVGNGSGSLKDEVLNKLDYADDSILNQILNLLNGSKKLSKKSEVVSKA